MACHTDRPAATARAPNEMPYSPVATAIDSPKRMAGVQVDGRKADCNEFICF